MDKRRYIVIFLLLTLVAGAYFYLSPPKSAGHSESTEVDVTKSAASLPSFSPVIKVGGTTIPVEVATTTAAVRKGLSGRRNLEEDMGMLFVFSVPDFYRFWMPDMHFPIDIVWIRDGLVVDISRDVSNEFDPAQPVFYSPREKAKYVLEVTAGFAAQKGLKIGDPVVLRNIF